MSAWFAIHLRDVRFHRRLENRFCAVDRTDADDIAMTAQIVSDITALLPIHQCQIVPANRTLAAHIVMRTLMGHVHAALETPLPDVTSEALEHAMHTWIRGYLTAPAV